MGTSVKLKAALHQTRLLNHPQAVANIRLPLVVEFGIPLAAQYLVCPKFLVFAPRYHWSPVVMTTNHCLCSHEKTLPTVYLFLHPKIALLPSVD